jgi:hypothetical protein
MPELPQYQCHKTVRAAKIAEVQLYCHPTTGGCLKLISSFGLALPRVEVSESYLAKHQPVAGGYYVLYEDGYESFSPAEAFESGYTRIE